MGVQSLFSSMLWMFFLNNISPSPVELSFGGTCNMSLAPPYMCFTEAISLGF